MSLSADVPPFVSRPVFHGNAPSQYHLPQGGGYIAANPQVAPVPPPAPSASNQGGGYPHYMVNCYPYVAESVPQDGRQQSYPTQAGASPYTVPHASHPYQTPSPYDGYQPQQPQQQHPVYQPLPPEQQGITTYQDPYYPSAAYYPQVPPQPSFQQPLPQGVQGPVQHPPAPGYASVPPPQSYQVPYTAEPQGYPQQPPPQVPQVRQKNYSGNKHRSARYSNDHSNVGCEAVAAELEAVKKKKMVVYTDADCQTDFPEHIANKTLSERPIEELVPSVKAVTKSTGNQTGPDDGSGGNRSSSDSCEEEEEEEELKPQDSDSGYSAAGDVSGGKSYARVASQHYMPQQPYQQQWPLPPTMSSQGSGPVSTAPVSSWARIAAGGHPPALHHPPSSQHQYPPHQIQHQPSGHHPHHPHQQQHHRQSMPQPPYQQQGQMVPHSQHQSHMASQGQQQGHMASQSHHQGHMVPQGQQQGHMTSQSQHQGHMASHSQHHGPTVPHGQHQGPMVPHAPPVGVAPQQQFPGHYPPPMQAQPGVVRLPPQPGPKNHPRQRRKTSGPQWVPPPPPMINDASEYPDLPVAASRSMMGYGGNPPQSNYSNILQQKLKVNNEIDSDTSSEKDLPHSMLQSEELRGNKMFRKKVKKPSQDYLGMMVSPAPPQDTAKMTGKRSQRPMEIPLTGLLLNNPQQAPQQSFMPGGQMPFNAGQQQFMGPPPPIAYQQQPQQQSMGQIPVQWANNVPGTRGPTLRAHDRNEMGRKNISGNPLDSSGVTMKGKQRENPAKKKPSAMKKVIIAERQEKKRIRDMQEKKLSDNEEALSQSTVELESSCYDSSFGLSQDPPSDRNSLSFNTHSDYSPVSQQDQLSLSPLSPGMGASSQNGGICSSQTEVLAMKQIHSNKWREYCKQIVSKEIDASCTTLLQTLIRFQERQYNRDGPIKAKSKRRIVMGLREVSKHLEKGKITCIIISTNLEKIQSKGGIDDVLQKITIKAEDMGVPVVYALCRSALGRAVNKIVPVSVVGVFSYNGAEDVFKELTSLVETARKEYQELLLEQKHVIEMKNVRNMKKLGHRRNISNCSGISFSSVISNPISENDPEPEPEDELEELEGPTEATEVCEDAGSVNRESSTEKTNSEASACTVEERQRRALAQQDQPSDQPCDHIADEGAAAGVRDEEGDSEGDERNIGDEDHDDDEDEEDDSEKALAPEISVDERVNSWVAENQIQNVSVEEKA